MTTPAEEKESVELRHSCIGELEHDLHTAFAAKRVPSEDFVHVQVIRNGQIHHLSLAGRCRGGCCGCPCALFLCFASLRSPLLLRTGHLATTVTNSTTTR